jgi:hypothetical protein
MQSLRSARFLARFMAAWFVLVVGFATAAPIVQPQSLDVICSGGTMKLVMAGDGEDGQASASVTLDCPLCMSVAPPPVSAAVPALPPLGRAVQSIPAAHIASFARAALPPRGPPLYS